MCLTSSDARQRPATGVRFSHICTASEAGQVCLRPRTRRGLHRFYVAELSAGCYAAIDENHAWPGLAGILVMAFIAQRWIDTVSVHLSVPRVAGQDRAVPADRGGPGPAAPRLPGVDWYPSGEASTIRACPPGP
jgi:hypothetical protein